MIPWVTVDEARADDGTVLTLARHGGDWEVRWDGFILMASREHGSEDDLARLAFERAPHAEAVLVGGLGLGFSLRAALDRLGPRGRAAVAERSPAVVEWNRTHVGALAGHPLDDPRVSVSPGDVRARIAGSQAAWDLILLDVDNGPASLIHRANARLYDADGIAACRRALKDGGVLAVWAAAPDERYLRRLVRGGFSAEAVKVPPRKGAGGRKHVVFLGVRGRRDGPPGGRAR